jgi:hypothetical protein
MLGLAFTHATKLAIACDRVGPGVGTQKSLERRLLERLINADPKPMTEPERRRHHGIVLIS